MSDTSDTEAPREAQEVRIETQLGFGASMQYDQQWIAYFDAQDAPNVHGVDPNLFRGDGRTMIA